MTVRVKNRAQVWAGSAYRGNYNFATDSDNPLNTGDGFSNALLGSVDSYMQANNWPIGSYLFHDFEWYAQDNWRISRRLTLDYGLRFYHMPATVDNNHTIATFDPSLYSFRQRCNRGCGRHQSDHGSYGSRGLRRTIRSRHRHSFRWRSGRGN